MTVPAREHVVRAMWTLFEPIHAVSYFTPQAREGFASVGLTRYWDGYFAGRAAPLGPVDAAPVIALFSGFAPYLVERALPSVWSSASVEEVLHARSTGAAEALRTIIPDESSVARAADALTVAAQRADTIGRALSAANRALPDEREPYRRLWQAATTLREHRGDGHVIALVSTGIAGLSSVVLRSALDRNARTLRLSRGWTDHEWAAEGDRLVARGLLNADHTISSAGVEALEGAEHLTNRLAAEPWSHLSDIDLVAVASLVAPLAHACRQVLPQPSPLGHLPQWDPQADPLATAVSTTPVADDNPVRGQHRQQN
ncbi:hypothetical protein [Homoserinimonas sp. OAct 916]|uniref:SCO6745 family protein n=1 Tax=Homoserinimonas sp. OAct 916 TaxID=2211450 RepID=UPI0018E585BC|nr:hypothetical protein [Homoserinimonas sp. OAct 916]